MRVASRRGSNAGRVFGGSGMPVAATAAFAILPLIFGSGTYLLTEFESIGALMLVAIGLNVVTGYAGQLTLGPSAVFAIGAFAAVVFANHHPGGASLALLCVIGAVAAAIAGIVIGLPALRIGGFYLALVTLFVAQAVPTIANAWSVTGATNGISLVSNLHFKQSTTGMSLYEATVVLVGVALIGSAVLKNSRLGRRMIVLKSSEELASSLGCSPYRLKMTAVLISAVAAGVGGGLYVYSQQFMSGSSANVNTSIYLLAACAIGGLGVPAGPAFGMALVYGLQDFLGLDKYTDLIFGGTLAIVALALPDGLLGTGREVLRWLLTRRSGVSPVLTVQPSSVSAEELRASLGEAAVSPSVLSAVNLRRSFGGVAAVDGVSLTVRTGTVHGLIGSNGSGKTTLLNLVTGFYSPDHGRVAVGDVHPRPGHPDLGVKAGLGRSFQTPKLVEHETVLQNVLPLRRSTGQPEFVDVAMRLVGLEPLADIEVRKLPHGTRRLVEIARALALRPRFILLDEPAAGLAEVEFEVLKTAITTMREAGLGILLVEHNVPLVAGLADEVTVMHLGKAIAQGPPSLVLDDEAVASAFLGSSAPDTSAATQ